MADTPTLVRFLPGWEAAGIGDDGLPLFKENILLQADRPPHLSLTRVAEPDDFLNHPGAFELFQKEMDARKTSYAEGYPLEMWPAVTPHVFQMLVHRDVTTVEQLAKLHRKGAANQSLP